MKKLHPEVTDDMLIESYLRLRSFAKVAAETGVPERRAMHATWRHNIQRQEMSEWHKRNQKYPQETQLEIVRLHENGSSIVDLQKQFGGSKSSIRMAILRNGCDVKPGITTRREFTPQEIANIKEEYLAGKSQAAIAISLGYDQTTISRIMRENDIEARKRGHLGDRHHNWKGGRGVYKGYASVIVHRDDPMAEMRTINGYVLEHRLVMARKLGRPLDRRETVHHIDGNKLNNHPDNLQLRQGPHGKGTVLCCGVCGSHNIISSELG